MMRDGRGQLVAPFLMLIILKASLYLRKLMLPIHGQSAFSEQMATGTSCSRRCGISTADTDLLGPSQDPTPFDLGETDCYSWHNLNGRRTLVISGPLKGGRSRKPRVLCLQKRI